LNDVNEGLATMFTAIQMVGGFNGMMFSSCMRNVTLHYMVKFRSFLHITMDLSTGPGILLLLIKLTYNEVVW
jgi:hypothetical protein